MNWTANTHVPPRQAAAVVLYRNASAFETLMIQRNPALRFMGGHHAFPGGSLDDDDAHVPVHGAADAASAARIVCAVREVFEETGLFLWRGAAPERDALRDARSALLERSCTFAEVLHRFEGTLDAADFAPAGIWITPPFSPIRFETQYFLARYDGPDWEELTSRSSEIVGLEWVRPGAIRAAWQGEKVRISTPVAFVLRRLEAYPPEEALPLLRETPGRDFEVPNFFEPRRGIHIIPVRSATLPPATHTNCMVVGERELVIVDPGAADAAEQDHLIAHIDGLRALGGRIRAILVTHDHGDHIAAVDRLRKVYGVPVLAHRDANQVGADDFLEDGDTIPLEGEPGWRLRCLHTPGHHPGHVCFYEETTHTLLCGDMAACPGFILISRDHGGDMAAYMDSLERLLALPFTFLVPGHGLPSFSGIDGRAVLEATLEHRRDRERAILAALDAGATTEDALLEAAYTDVERSAWPLARLQLRAHLHALGRDPFPD